MSTWILSIRLLATWFGCGRAPFFPGTVGTLGALPLVWLLGRGGEEFYLAATAAFVVLAIFVAQVYETQLVSRHDSPELVIDEVAGFLITMAGMPFSWSFVVTGFVLFRIFDMLKPFPISYLDRKVPGGFGAVIDDVVAGLAGNLVLQFLLHKGVFA